MAVSRLDPQVPVASGKMRPDKLPNPRKPKLRKIALLMPTFGHSGHSVIGLTPTPVRQQKFQDPSGLQPGSRAFKNPQPVLWLGFCQPPIGWGRLCLCQWCVARCVGDLFAGLSRDWHSVSTGHNGCVRSPGYPFGQFADSSGIEVDQSTEDCREITARRWLRMRRGPI